jgi:hypothetical protein
MTSACRTLTRRNRASQGPWRHRRGRAGRGAGWSGTASGTRVVAAPGWPPRWGSGGATVASRGRSEPPAHGPCLNNCTLRGQAGCTDAICSAGSSTNTTDERMNAFAHPTGSYPSGRRIEACQPHRASQPSRARVADAWASMVMLLDIPPPATGQQRSQPQCRAALAAPATTTTSC